MTGDDGIVAKIAERVFENPALSGGLFVMVLTAAAIISNAVFLQSAHHPQPLFLTRPGPTPAVPTPRPEVVPIPRSRSDQAAGVTTASAQPPLPRIAPPPDESQVTDNTNANVAGLVAELQRSLAAKGLYKGSIDGIFGSRTQAAISAYQKAEGLAVTGEPSDVVLDHIKTAKLAATEPAEAATKARLETPKAPTPSSTASTGPARAEEPALSEPPTPAATTVADDPARKRYLAVQRALNRIGYGPVPEDGWGGGETADALRRFELDNGLSITGLPGNEVVERLIAIGAMSAL